MKAFYVLVDKDTGFYDEDPSIDVVYGKDEQGALNAFINDYTLLHTTVPDYFWEVWCGDTSHVKLIHIPQFDDREDTITELDAMVELFRLGIVYEDDYFERENDGNGYVDFGVKEELEYRNAFIKDAMECTAYCYKCNKTLKMYEYGYTSDMYKHIFCSKECLERNYMFTKHNLYSYDEKDIPEELVKSIKMLPIHTLTRLY